MFKRANLAVAISLVFLLAPEAKAGRADDIIDAIETKIDAINTTITSIQTTVGNVKTTADETVGRIRDGVATLKGKLKDLIDDTVDDVQMIVERELEGRDAFLNDGTGAAFRSDLVTLLREFDTLQQNLADLVPGAPRASFEDEIDFLEDVGIPLRLLWPLYRVATTIAPDFPKGLIDQLKETNEALTVIKPMFAEEEAATQPPAWGRRRSNNLRAQTAGGSSPRSGFAILAGRPSSWIDYSYGQVPGIVKNQPGLVEKVSKVIRRRALALKVLSTFLKAQGKTGIGKQKDVQIHGYVGLTIETDPTGTWGERFGGISDVLNKIADKIDGNLDKAALYGSLRELRNNQQAIMDKLGVAYPN